MSEPTIRGVAAVVDAAQTLEGAGFPVRRPFPTPRLDHVDPFLLLDHLGPTEWGPGEAVGAPDHPHRGFETVTYILAGQHEHRDSQGNSGVLGPGAVQWMTAGAGVVHSEMPEPSFRRSGGLMHGVQLWVNLPARDKMMAPRYQDIPASSIPEAEGDGGRVRVRVIAGESLGHSAIIETRTPIMYLHFTLQPGGRIVQPVGPAHNALAYLLSGQAAVGSETAPVGEGQLAVFGPGEAVLLAAPETAAGPAELLLLAGMPLREPVARYGPFVMNTREELIQAFNDYQAGRMGAIAG